MLHADYPVAQVDHAPEICPHQVSGIILKRFGRWGSHVALPGVPHRFRNLSEKKAEHDAPIE